VSSLVRVFCEDGRDFIREVTARALDDPIPRYMVQSKRSRKKNSMLQSTQNVSLEPPKVGRMRISHFVMNLPDSAIQFLDAFRGILSRIDASYRDLREIYDVMPMIHCHCFTRELDHDKAKADILTVGSAR
jgi:tRNA (guanine37-N1)-methyltransferase